MDDVAVATIDRQLVEARVRMRLFGEDSRPFVAERFRLVERIGEGGMGVVYAAYDTTLDRKVALKMARPEAAVEQSRSRQVREAQALAKIGHPNIVAVYDIVTQGSLTFVAMELIQGETLRRWTARVRPPWRNIVSLMTGAARGLAAAHAQGLVHRDFKPENVMVTNDGTAKVLDFGLVRPVELPVRSAAFAPTQGSITPGITRASAVLGTLGYMAPEQYDGGEVDARADQYSFCATLFEALYGRPARPNGDVDIRSETRRLLDAEAPPRRSGVPASLERVVMRGLSRLPGDRFSSMDALIAELESSGSFAFRRPSLSIGAALMVVLAMVSGFFLKNHFAPQGNHSVRRIGEQTLRQVPSLLAKRTEEQESRADARVADLEKPKAAHLSQSLSAAGRKRPRAISTVRGLPRSDSATSESSGSKVPTDLVIDENPFNLNVEVRPGLSAPPVSSLSIDRPNPFP